MSILFVRRFRVRCSPTILYFSHPSFEIVQRQVRDLVFQAVEIHLECLVQVRCQGVVLIFNGG